MGTITISINDETEEIFREVVEQELGTGKGKLGQAVQEALQEWIKEKKEEEIAKRQLVFLEKGYKFGKFKFSRDEL
ncbi:hypothetical protein HYX12_00660, partial [Candidatus Woesearchaeota archaeon]|nr:hypothetical protein [Candidatus Woesearchaeota archaeon]